MPRAWLLKSRPSGMPTPDNFELGEIPAVPLGEGEVRVRNSWLSVDPYMRGRMNDVKSYVPPFQIGEPLQGGAIGAVIESRAEGLVAGDLVQHILGWRDEAQGPAAYFTRLPALDLPPQAFLGQLGVPGMTAYFGLLDVGQAKAGDTVFVSAAAGAVGSTVVQIAKARGMTVIGSAGGADKCAWVKALGADHVIDYKAGGSLVKALAATAPEGIDVYFDNVGGAHLDAALAIANQRAHFAICGMIEGYNESKPTELRYLARLIGQRITMRGFIVIDYFSRMAEFHQDMAAMRASGALQSHETIHDGLEAAPEAFIALFRGGNIGKMLVRL